MRVLAALAALLIYVAAVISCEGVVADLLHGERADWQHQQPFRSKFIIKIVDEPCRRMRGTWARASASQEAEDDEGWNRSVCEIPVVVCTARGGRVAGHLSRCALDCKMMQLAMLRSRSHGGSEAEPWAEHPQRRLEGGSEPPLIPYVTRLGRHSRLDHL